MGDDSSRKFDFDLFFTGSRRKLRRNMRTICVESARGRKSKLDMRGNPVI
jgi:hypothetical protein